MEKAKVKMIARKRNVRLVPARWLALITNTYRAHLGYEIVQIEDSPDWKGSWEKSVKHATRST